MVQGRFVVWQWPSTTAPGTPRQTRVSPFTWCRAMKSWMMPSREAPLDGTVSSTNFSSEPTPLSYTASTVLVPPTSPARIMFFLRWGRHPGRRGRRDRWPGYCARRRIIDESRVASQARAPIPARMAQRRVVVKTVAIPTCYAHPPRDLRWSAAAATTKTPTIDYDAAPAATVSPAISSPAGPTRPRLRPTRSTPAPPASPAAATLPGGHAAAVRRR